jgi:hypothetical protein
MTGFALMNDCVSALWNASADVAGYSCLNLVRPASIRVGTASLL